MKRVVVIGFGVFILIGNNIEEYVVVLMNGVSGVNVIMYFDVSKFKIQFVCEIKDLDIVDVLDCRDLCCMDKFF